ncbi:MAG: radical SAM/SPASM domain-containing protein [Planctomycetota bacterium]
MHPRFADAVRTCREYGVIPLFSTNGQNLSNEQVLNDLIREPPAYLIVAIDGLTDETNTKYRAGAKLEPALQGVRQLAQMKRERGQELPVMNMRFIVMSHNEHEVPHVTRFAAENGFDMLTIRTLGLRDTGEALHQRLVPHQERFRAYQYHHGQRIRRDDFVCHLAFFFPTVLTDGTVVTCDQDFNGSQAYGRVGEDGSFADVWWSDRAAEVRRTILRSPQAYSCCGDCPFADRATSACSLEAFHFRRGAGGRHAVGAEL